MGTKLNPSPYDCYHKALPDEPIFVLLGRDEHAPEVVSYWAHLRAGGSPRVKSVSLPPTDSKALEALRCAQEMHRYRTARMDTAPAFQSTTDDGQILSDPNVMNIGQFSGVKPCSEFPDGPKLAAYAEMPIVVHRAPPPYDSLGGHDDGTAPAAGTTERRWHGVGPVTSKDFLQGWDSVSAHVNATANEKGWWDKERNDGEIIALMHSELSEGLEGLRHGNPPSNHIPQFSAVEEEMADVVIRIMDYARARGFNVGQAILAKIQFNDTRERMHGGKKF